jgi:hypothetical protein
MLSLPHKLLHHVQLKLFDHVILLFTYVRAQKHLFRVTDTGCQIMTRKAHGRNAGPWLGANTVTFGIAGALVPLMELFTSSLIVQFSILASVSFLLPLKHCVALSLS